MRITLKVVAGPHQGLEFSFSRHDTFLVGRSRHAHFRLPLKDKYFSRVHFMVEVNPPQCRMVDMGSRNGTYINGARLLFADLHHGDQIRAGHTILQLSVHAEDGDPREAAHAPPEFRGIPGYQLERELGRGGMGTVYLARRLADGAQVALKTIASRAAGSPAQVERFLKDARVLRDLVHPNIVRFQDEGLASGLLYFVMDYVAGSDAGTILATDGPFAIQRAVGLMAQVLEALEYAHGKNRVHRDIKPSNILVTEMGGREVCRLADFGLARVYHASPLSGLTMTVNVGDSAAFMPPELITNYQGTAPAADQYAAAATLYTLLTGKHVLDLPAEIHRQFSLILKAQPVPIRERRADISSSLAAVIHNALARNPAQRFPDVAAFHAALVKAVG